MSTKTLEELKAEFLAEQSELRHAGVKGMKWGVRKSEKVYDARARAVGLAVKRNNIARAGLSEDGRLSIAAKSKIQKLDSKIQENNKTANVSATKKERAVQIQAGVGLGLVGASYIAAKVSQISTDPAVKQGAMAIAALGTAGALGLTVSTALTQGSANKDEMRYHESK